MKKTMMVMKNQVNHVKAERDVLASASTDNRWLTVLHYSFQDDTNLYMVMEVRGAGEARPNTHTHTHTWPRT